MWAKTKRTPGFTIVELLIVIVVIGILAAITIVAYNGIQTRAENVKTISGVSAYAKAFSLYAVDKGVYPSTNTYPCLGTPTGGLCAKITTVAGGCDYSGMAPTDSAFDSLIMPYMGSSKPSISEQKMTCSGSVYMGGYVNANSLDTKNLSMQIYLKGTTCPVTMGTAVLVSASQTGEVTMCYMQMPAL